MFLTNYRRKNLVISKGGNFVQRVVGIGRLIGSLVIVVPELLKLWAKLWHEAISEVLIVEESRNLSQRVALQLDEGLADVIDQLMDVDRQTGTRMSLPPELAEDAQRVVGS